MSKCGCHDMINAYYRSSDWVLKLDNFLIYYFSRIIFGHGKLNEKHLFEDDIVHESSSDLTRFYICEVKIWKTRRLQWWYHLVTCLIYSSINILLLRSECPILTSLLLYFLPLLNPHFLVAVDRVIVFKTSCQMYFSSFIDILSTSCGRFNVWENEKSVHFCLHIISVTISSTSTMKMCMKSRIRCRYYRIPLSSSGCQWHQYTLYKLSLFTWSRKYTSSNWVNKISR